MKKFSAENLKIIKLRFKKKRKEGSDDGLTLTEFVNLMRQVIDHDTLLEKEDLVVGLIELFKEIDINGDGDMQWDEFADYIIQAVNK